MPSQQLNPQVQTNSVQVLPTSGIHACGNHSLTMSQNGNQLASPQTSVHFQAPATPIPINSGHQNSQNVGNSLGSRRSSRDQSYQDSLEALRRNLVMTLGSDPSNSHAQRSVNSNRVNQATVPSLQTPPVIHIIMDTTTRNTWNPLQDLQNSIPVPTNPGLPSQRCFNSPTFNPLPQAPSLAFNPMYCTQDFHLGSPWSTSGNSPWGPSRSPMMHPYYNILWDPYLNLPWDPYMNRPYIMPYWSIP